MIKSWLGVFPNIKKSLRLYYNRIPSEVNTLMHILTGSTPLHDMISMNITCNCNASPGANNRPTNCLISLSRCDSKTWWKNSTDSPTIRCFCFFLFDAILSIRFSFAVGWIWSWTKKLQCGFFFVLFSFLEWNELLCLC